MQLAFGEPTGQGWTQVAELAVAFALSLLIGLEREAQQKSAGMRTYTLVGLGAALFVLISKYGFTDVLGGHVILDPSRVAAQIVSGLGFIGGGLIFVRRDAVRGLTTAASVWLTAGIGAAAGAGLPVLAAFTTALYFLVMYLLRPLSALAHRFRPETVGLYITYLDGRGVLRSVLNAATRQGFVIADLATVQVSAAGAQHANGVHDGDDGAGEPSPGTVDVTLVLSGRGDLPAMTDAVSAVEGVLSVRQGPPSDE